MIGFLCLSAVVASLVSVVFFVYYAEEAHSHESSCHVFDCTVIVGTYVSCSGTSSSQVCTTVPYTCFALVLELTIPEHGIGNVGAPGTYNGTYSGTFSSYPSVCSQSTVKCYYSDEDISGSLTLTEDDVLAGGIAAIVVFSILLPIVLLLFLGSLVWWCNRARPIQHLAERVRKNQHTGSETAC